MITEADEQNPLNFGSNVGHKVSIIIFLEITTLYTKFLYLFTNATEPARATIDGIESVRMIQKGQITGQTANASSYNNFVNLMAA